MIVPLPDPGKGSELGQAKIAPLVVAHRLFSTLILFEMSPPDQQLDPDGPIIVLFAIKDWFGGEQAGDVELHPPTFTIPSPG